MRGVTSVACIAMAGCSFLTARGPDARGPKGEVTCTSSDAAPLVDFLVAIPFAALSVSGFSKATGPMEPDVHDTGSFVGEGVATGLIAVSLLASAIYGLQTIDTEACAAAKKPAQ